MNKINSLQVYWCGPLLGGIAAALLYENVFAVNASLVKAKGFLLSADYDPADYEPNKEQPAEVCNEVNKVYTLDLKMTFPLLKSVTDECSPRLIH